MFTLKIKPEAEGDLLAQAKNVFTSAGHLNATEPLKKITVTQTGRQLTSGYYLFSGVLV